MFIKIGDELFNLNNVARINLLGGKKVEFRFIAPEITIPGHDLYASTDSETSSLEPFVFEDEKDIAALQWFFTDYILSIEPLLTFVDVVAMYESHIERERRRKKEFRAGDRVYWLANPQGSEEWSIDRIEGDKAVLIAESTDSPGIVKTQTVPLSELAFNDD